MSSHALQLKYQGKYHQQMACWWHLNSITGWWALYFLLSLQAFCSLFTVPWNKAKCFCFFCFKQSSCTRALLWGKLGLSSSNVNKNHHCKACLTGLHGFPTGRRLWISQIPPTMMALLYREKSHCWGLFDRRAVNPSHDRGPLKGHPRHSLPRSPEKLALALSMNPFMN